MDPAGAEAAKKTRRGKSSEQRLHQNDHEYSVIQVKLNSFLRASFATEVTNLFEDIAQRITRIGFEAYIIANYHILRLLEEGKELPQLDQSFFYSCCAQATASTRQSGDEALRATATDYRSLRPQGWVPTAGTHLGKAMASLAREMSVAAKNHIVLNLLKRLERYVRIRYKLTSKGEAISFMRGSFMDKPEALTFDQKEFKEWIQMNPFFEDQVKNNIPHFVSKLRDILRYYDELEPGTKGVKKFTLLPTKGSYVGSFFFIDKSTLPDVLGLLDPIVQRKIVQSMLARPELDSDTRNFLEVRLKARTTFSQDFQKNQNVAQALWDTLFETTKYETGTRKFAWKVSTNGYAISIFLEKPKSKNPKGKGDTDNDYDSPKGLNEADFDHFIGIDPGGTFVCTAYAGKTEGSKPGRSQCVAISTNFIKHESKERQWRDAEKSMRKANPAYQQGCDALESLKTAKFEVFKDRVRSALAQAQSLFAFSEKKLFRAWRFKRGRFNKQAMHKAVKKVLGPGTNPKRTLVGFGDWSQQDGFLKGIEKAPVKKMRATMRRLGAKVVEIDEHRTSKCCSECKVGVNKNLYYGEGTARKRCHQVVRCNNSECGMVWQRDVNASRNMHCLLLCLIRGDARPAGLKRRKKT